MRQQKFNKWIAAQDDTTKQGRRWSNCCYYCHASQVFEVSQTIQTQHNVKLWPFNHVLRAFTIFILHTDALLCQQYYFISRDVSYLTAGQNKGIATCGLYTTITIYELFVHQHTLSSKTYSMLKLRQQHTVREILSYNIRSINLQN